MIKHSSVFQTSHSKKMSWRQTPHSGMKCVWLNGSCQFSPRPKPLIVSFTWAVFMVYNRCCKPHLRSCLSQFSNSWFFSQWFHPGSLRFFAAPLQFSVPAEYRCIPNCRAMFSAAFSMLARVCKSLSALL